MSNTHRQPLLFSVGYSRRLHHLLSIAHFLALLACLLSSLPISYRAALLLAVTVHYLKTVNRQAQTPLRLCYHPTTGWRMADNHDWLAVAVLPSSILNKQALFLHLEILEKDTKSFGIAEKIKETLNKRGPFTLRQAQNERKQPLAVALALQVCRAVAELFHSFPKAKRRKAIVIMADALSPDDFRRLMVTLKIAWRATPHSNVI